MLPPRTMRDGATESTVCARAAEPHSEKAIKATREVGRNMVLLNRNHLLRSTIAQSSPSATRKLAA
ncbi:MAG: hypothetical protein ACK56F_15905 [bacterium]